MLLDRYIGQTVLRAFLLIAAGLTALFSLLVFVEQLALIGQGRYGLGNALAYTALTAPSRLLLLAPVCMLLATLLGLGGLARHAELTAFRGFGVSEARIIGAVLKLCVPIALALFLLAQFVIPPAQLAAQREQAAALGNAVADLAGGGFWVHKGRIFLNVRDFSGGNRLTGIGLYTLAPDGTLLSFIAADRATIEPDGSWALTGVIRKQTGNGRTETDSPPRLLWKPFLSPRQLRLLTMPPQMMPPLTLLAYIRALKRQHQQAILYAQAFWSMVAVPIALFGMALIAAPFVFETRRSGTAGRQILVGGLIGIVFLLVQQIIGYLGILLALDPAGSALAPSLVLAGLGAWLLERRHERLGPPFHLPDPAQKFRVGRFLRPEQNQKQQGEAQDFEQKIQQR